MATTTSGTKCVRTRISPKSRTGCSTCKRKRLKCDESKPECLNCLNRKLTCPGYQQEFKWHAKRQMSTKSFSTKRCESKDILEFTHYSVPLPKPLSRSTNGAKQDCVFVVDEDDDDIPDEYINFDSNSFDEMLALCQDSATSEPLDISAAAPEDSSSTLGSSLSDAHYSPSSSKIDSNEPILPIYQNELTTFAALQVYNSPVPNAKHLLRRFYKTSSRLPSPLFHQSTQLVQYYFSTICGVYSCFDSVTNPFRHFVDELWTHSEPLYYAIQSMAAAHLGNEMPHMRKNGILLHQKASNLLGLEVKKYGFNGSQMTRPLLIVLLLGLSACWHQAADLGMTYLKIARRIMNMSMTHADTYGAKPSSGSTAFCEEAMIYWEMLYSFVADDYNLEEVSDNALDNCERLEQVENLDTPQMDTQSLLAPHPWTGVSPESQMLLAEVGRLIRRYRVHRISLSEPELARCSTIAFDLEEKLLTTILPTAEAVSPSGDPTTSIDDFLTLASVTRDCGLLEIYKVFPDILRQRFGMIHDDDSQIIAVSSTQPSNPQLWLTLYAVQILRQTEMIPNDSRVRAHQLLPIMIAAAELRFHWHEQQPTMALHDHLEIHWARSFTRSRLQWLATQLPAKPVQTMLELLDEVWNRFDGFTDGMQDDVFWMDVMVEKGLYTMMG